MNIKNNFPFLSTVFLVILFVLSCQGMRREVVSFRTHVNFFEANLVKSEKFNKILINRIKRKPSSFSSVANDNITENLRFHLLNSGFIVGLTVYQEDNNSEPSELLDLEQKQIKEFIKQNDSDILIDGFLYEKNTGNILDETVSTGIILKAYNKNGILIGKFVLNSPYSTEDFENNFLLSGLLSKKIDTIFKNRIETSYNLLKYFK
ncbi:MAG: hypothetical protein GW938_17080 [Leptospira sp.]|nr:hypothetical protein [Leptospira sp.]